MILSSRQQPYDPVRGAEVQADDFIDKPFDTQQMRDKVKKLVASNGSKAASPKAASMPAAAAPARPAPIPRTPPPAMPPPPGRSGPTAQGGRAAAPATPIPPAPLPAAIGNAVAANGAALRAKLENLDLTPEQTQAILALSRDVIERVVWEVVPVLAETLIKEEIQRLTRE
jgi:hypothetical protein